MYVLLVEAVHWEMWHLPSRRVLKEENYQVLTEHTGAGMHAFVTAVWAFRVLVVQLSRWGLALQQRVNQAGLVCSTEGI